VEQLSDDDEIYYYIALLNTLIASQGISSASETLHKDAIISQFISILQTANLKIVFQLLYHQLIQFKVFQYNFLWR
jgi:hypothetical protein